MKLSIDWCKNQLKRTIGSNLTCAQSEKFENFEKKLSRNCAIQNEWE